jgi:hypothetical protein
MEVVDFSMDVRFGVNFAFTRFDYNRRLTLNVLKFLQAFVAAVSLSLALPAQATVVMTDGMLVTYDPNETYVPSGTLGPDIFSIGWIYTDPTYSNTITLTMPSTLVGQMLWAVTSGIDGTGISSFGGSLMAGESEVVTMGNFGVASVDNPATSYFSMAAFDMPEPIAFGPTVGGELIDIPAVPEPETWAILLAGLVLVGLMARRRGIQNCLASCLPV